MKAKIFIANKWTIAIYVFIINFLICSNGYTMKTKDISNYELNKYESIARQYVESSRGWKPSEYKIRFSFIDPELEMCVFDANNIRSSEEVKKRAQAENYQGIRQDPSWFFIMVHTRELKAYEDNPDIPTPWDSQLRRKRD